MDRYRIIFGMGACVVLAVASGCAGGSRTAGRTVEPYRVVAYKPSDPEAVRVKVSLSNQMVYVMEGDRLLMVTPTTTGRAESPTPSGTFRVTNKVAKKRSCSEGFWVNGGSIVAGTISERPSGSGWRYVGFPMAYWVEFQPAYGFHEGSVWPTPRTQGSLRLHRNAAPRFFALVRPGTPVSIAQSQPEDATFGRDVERPDDYGDPDLPASVLISDAAFPATGRVLLEEG